MNIRLAAIILSIGFFVFQLGNSAGDIAPVVKAARPSVGSVSLAETGLVARIEPGAGDRLNFHLRTTPYEVTLTSLSDNLHLICPDLSCQTGSPRQLRFPLDRLAGRQIRFEFGRHQFTVSLAPNEPVDLAVVYYGRDQTLTLTTADQLRLTSLEWAGPLTLNLTTDRPKTVILGALTATALTVSGGTPIDHLRFTGPVKIGQVIRLNHPGTVTLAESELVGGGDVYFRVGHILYIRDSAAQSVIIRAGGRLRLEGVQQVNISALHHPGSALISQGDMVLRSNEAIRGDIHYLAGGNFKIEQANGRAGDLISPDDPIILAEGDVSLGDYTGASLHILAGGQVLLNSATITGTETTANTISPGNTTLLNGTTSLGDVANLTLSNGTAVVIDGSTRPTLDIRAGINWAGLGGPPIPPDQVIPPGSVTPTFSGATGAAITVTRGITITPPAGVVLLTNQYQPGDLAGNIFVGDITAGTALPNSDGSSITLDSRADITTGALTGQAEVTGLGVTAGDGGPITLLAPNGSITSAGNLSTFARVPVNNSGTAGNGGAILLAAAGDISLNGGNAQVESFASANSEGDAGNGGDISIETTGGDIALGTLLAQSFAGTNGAAGNGGSVTVTTGDGAINIGGGFFASVQTFAQDFNSTAGDAGNVVISATTGLSVAQAIQAYAPGSGSQAGDITLITSGGNLEAGDLQAFAANTSSPGLPGNVTARALNGGVTVGDIEAYANALFINNPAQAGGNITVEAGNGDVVMGRLRAFSEARGQLGDTGDGGSIQVIATNGSISGQGDILAYARSAINNGDSGLAGAGGSILLQATNNISITGNFDSSSQAQIFGGEGGAASSGGPIILAAENGAITIGGNLAAYAEARDSVANGGNISLTATNGITLNNGAGTIRAYAFAQEGSVGNGGDVSLTMDSGNLILQSIDSYAFNPFGTGTAGNGGAIAIQTGNGSINLSGNNFTALRADVATAGSAGNGGNITLTATQGINIAGPISARVRGIDGNGGDISLTTAAGSLTTTLVDASTAFGVGGSPGNGGNILLQALTGSLTTADVDTYSNAFFINNDSGNGGNITLRALNGEVTTGRLHAYSEARGAQGDTGNGGRIEVTATGGSIIAGGEVRADALSAINNNGSGVAGNGNNVVLQATANISITGGIRTLSGALNSSTGQASPTGAANAAGGVTLSANTIALSYIDARSVATTTLGRGGIVEITAGQFFQGSGVIFGRDETISTAGLPNSSAITITHGGDGVIPFIIGDPATNGVAGTLATGDASLTPVQAFFFDHFEPPNLWLLSTLPPALVINEIMKAPQAVLDENGEWIEIYNAGSKTFDLNGCRLNDDGGETHLINNGAPLLINPGQYVVLGSSNDFAVNGGVDVAYAYNFYFLNDAGDEVVLECGGLEIDRVNYDDGLTFPNPAGASMQLLAPTLDNNSGANWCQAALVWPGSAGDRGTPGQANICPTDLALSLTVTPPTLTPGQALTYTLIYTNAGPAVANAVITDIVPVELTNVGFISSGAPITPLGGLTYVWQVAGLLPGTGGVISITGVVSPSLAPGTVLTNTAQIATVSDSNASNNTAEVETTVVVEILPVEITYVPFIMKSEPPSPPDLVVDQLIVTSQAITVVVRNIGDTAVIDAFWVDVYINPATPPTGVNQAWDDVGQQGLVWGVIGPALPILTDTTLTLTFGDVYYRPDLSQVSFPLAVGTPVYAQVDSVNLLTTYGGVLESHEITGGAYNNITQTLSISGATVVRPTVVEPPVSKVDLPAR